MYFLSKVEPLLKMDQAKYPGKILKVSNIGRLIFNLWIPKGYVMSYVGGLRYANVSLISCRQTSAPKSRGYIACYESGVLSFFPKCTLGKFGCAFTQATS